MASPTSWEGHLLNGRLRIVRQIGRGGMGAVYEVFHENLRTVLALKQIASDLRDNHAIEKRFLQEAQMMARLQHPNIVRVYDTDRDPEFGSYIVMELIRGRDLGSLLEERGAFAAAETVRIGLGVAAALAYAHEKGIVHRDIKPANILLEEGTGRPIVTDFGIAKRISGEDATNLTGADTFVGTYRYSSREQIRNDRDKPIDGRADLYSIGVVLYELVTGRRYLEGLAELNIASCVGYQEGWRPTLQFPEPVPLALRVLLEQCLEPDRELRIESATALIERLRTCAAAEAVETRPGDVPRDVLEPSTDAPADEPDIDPRAQPRTAITVTERRAAERTRTIARLRSLRDVVGARTAAFERLIEEGAKLGLGSEELNGKVDVTQAVGAVERAEELGDFAGAARQLEEVSERLLARNQRVEAALGAAVAERLADLRARWQTLRERSAALLAEAEAEAALRAFDEVALALEDREWRACRRGLLRLESVLEESARRAERQARERIATLIADLEMASAEEREADAGVGSAAAEPAETAAAEAGDALEDPGALRAAVDALLARGQVWEAVQRAERAGDAAARRRLERRRVAIERWRAQLESLDDRLTTASAAYADLLDRESVARVEAALAALRAREPSPEDELDPPDASIARAALVRLEDLARERAERAVRESLREAEDLAVQLRGLGLDDAATEAHRRTEATHEAAQQLLTEGRLREALERASTALARSAAEHDEGRRILLDRGRELGTSVGEACQWLAARRSRLAGEDEAFLAEAAGLDPARLATLEARDLSSTLRHWDQLAQRLESIRGAVAERSARLSEQRRGRIEELLRALEGAPREIAEDLRQRAKSACRASAETPTDEELAALERIVPLLEEACSTAEVHAAAAARRAEIEAVATRVLPRGWRLRRSVRQGREARRALRAARAHFRAGRWTDAAAAYESAAAALTALETLRSEAAARRAEAAQSPARRPRSRASPRRQAVEASQDDARPAAAAPGRRLAARAIGLVLALLAGAVVLRLRSDPAWGPGSPEPPASESERPTARVEGAPGISDVPAGDVRSGSEPRPLPVAPPPPRPVSAIAAARPSEKSLAVAEGSAQEFRVTLAPALSREGAEIEWRLDDEPVARGDAVWTYRPGYADARTEPRRLEVRVAAAGVETARREWQIDVPNTNRVPEIVATRPDRGKPVSFRPGEPLALEAKAKDPDGDALTYEWTVDGEPAAASGEELRLIPRKDALVRLVVRDGAAETRAEWRLAKLAPPELVLTTSPRELTVLAYGREQVFEARPPAGEEGVTIEWTLDGERVASGPRFVLSDITPALVRKRPVRVSVRAAAREDARRFSRTWEFQIRPPAPRIAGSPPPGEPIRLDPGREQVFRAKPEGVIGEAGLRYTFAVDGDVVARRGEDRYVFAAREGRHRIQVYAEDVFGQRSAPLTWQVEVEAGLLARAERWVEDLEAALNRKDVERIAELRGLSGEAKRALADALADQLDLEVRFADRRFEEVGEDRVRVRYRRSDRFQDGPSREKVATAMELETELALSDGRLRERGTQRR